MESVKINLSSLGTKARSKAEMYRILTWEANLYLPPQKETSMYFVRDVIRKKKKVNQFISNISTGSL